MVTRLYFPSSGAAPISPAYDAAWEDTTAAARLAGVIGTPSATAMTTFEFLDTDVTNRDVLARQYIYGPLAAGSIAAGGTIEFQIRAQELNLQNDMFTALGVRAVAPDATTFRGTALAVTRDDSEMDANTLRNRRLTATASAITWSNGDYLVVEIGGGGDPTGGGGHDYRLRIGDNGGSDLPEDDTTTTDLNGWIEFPDTIALSGGVTLRRYTLPVLGVG